MLGAMWRKHITSTIVSTLGGLLLVVGLPSAASAKPARPEVADHGRKGELVLLTDTVPVVDAGDSVWIALKWTTTDVPVKDVRVTVKGDDLEVAYPENTGEYSAPWNGPNLAEGEVDYTAFRLEVPDDVDAFAFDVRATYVVEGKERKDRWTVKVPVQGYEGEDVILENPEMVLPEGAGWVELRFTGVAPSLRRFQVMIPDPAKAYLEYPQGDFASLERDNRLSRGETDVARFYLDTSYLGSGEHELEISAIYRRGGQTITTPFTLVITIP